MIDRNLLPSKQFTITFVSVIAVLAVGLAFTLTRNQPDDIERLFIENPEKAARLAMQKLAELDSDGDGLLDWEEALWGTDPFNPDTSGDGMLDGQAVKEGRDPLIPGPDNFLTQEGMEIRSRGGTEDGANEELNSTVAFARRFFEEYTKTKQSRLPVSAFIQDDLRVQMFLSEFEISETPTLTEEDFSIIQNVSAQNMRTYANEAASIMESHSGETQNSMVLFYRALQTGNAEELKKLKEISEAYDAIATNLSHMTIPRSVATQHIRMVNDLRVLAEVSKSMSTVNIDPLRTMEYLQEYIPRAQSIAQSFQAIGNSIRLSGARLAPNEPGYIFVSMKI